MLMLVSKDQAFHPGMDRANVRTLRTGDVLRFGADRMGAEIVIGFRPGIDKLLVVAGTRPNGHRCLVATEEHGEAVVIDGRGRRIVLQGVALADLTPGDIELSA